MAGTRVDNEGATSERVALSGGEARAPLEILGLKPFDRGELLDRLRATRLRGYDGAYPYNARSASLELACVEPEILTPAQRYVLRPGLEMVLKLRDALLPYGIDTFALDGGAYVETSANPGEWIPVIPPVVEQSSESGRLVAIINDGIHRVYAARLLGERISVVAAFGVPAAYPYYACALPGRWDDVQELDELPDGFQKKVYRDPECYKALFREFNEVFPGVQKQRRRTNPAHLRV
jgi:hypothetical protein